MGFASPTAAENLKKQRHEEDFERDNDGYEEEVDNRKLTHSQKKKKSVRIVDEKENVFESDNHNAAVAKSRGR